MSNYEVGYRKPPKNTRFQKGTSGNPGGRAKGSKNFRALLENELDQIIIWNDGGVKKKLTKREALAKRIVNSSLSGNLRAGDMVISKIEKYEEKDRENEKPKRRPLSKGQIAMLRRAGFEVTDEDETDDSE